MRLYLISLYSTNIQVVVNYNVTDKVFVVLKDNIISEKIAYSEKFRGMKTIENFCIRVTKDTNLLKDVSFKSAAIAENFVTEKGQKG